jgi:hypothetical protein
MKVSDQIKVTITAFRIFGPRNLWKLWRFWKDPAAPDPPKLETDIARILQAARQVLDLPADWQYSDEGLRQCVRGALGRGGRSLDEIWRAMGDLIEYQYNRETMLRELADMARRKAEPPSEYAEWFEPPPPKTAPEKR